LLGGETSKQEGVTLRNLKAGLLVFTVTTLTAVATVAGCSASGDEIVDSPDVDAAPGEDDSDSGSQLPPSGDDAGGGGTDAGTDSGKDAGKDAAKDASKDAAKEAAAPAPEPGDPCTTVDTKVSRSCGKCGQQEAICQAFDGGPLTWSVYGPCSNEAGECLPGTAEACGNCGTHTCSDTCGWSMCVQPANSCAAGTVEYTTAGCPTGGYKNRTCDATCQWDPYTSTCDIPTTSNKMTISSTVGQTVSQEWTLLTDTILKPNSSCTGAVSTTATRYIPVEVTNPTALAAEISAFHSKSPTGLPFDSVVWWYKTNALPLDDTQLGACVTAVKDNCVLTSLPTNPCKNDTDSSGIMAGADKITIPAGGKILVFVGGWTSSTDVGNGTFLLNLRTDKLQ
jgi:hypothetical protein